jgi:hypothetical protein
LLVIRFCNASVPVFAKIEIAQSTQTLFKLH